MTSLSPSWLRFTTVASCLAGVAACSFARPATPEGRASLPVFIGVTNESMLETPFELQLNGVLVLHTLAGRPGDVTGRVLGDTVRVTPGRYKVRVINRRTGGIREATLEAVPGPMFILIRFFPDATRLQVGDGIVAFM